MRLCEQLPQLRCRIKGSCSSCGKRVWDGSLPLSKLLPENLCPYAYFALVPYWMSFTQGASFRWRMAKDDVICQCASPGGPVFLAKAGTPDLISAEIIANVARCSYSLGKGAHFTIGENPLCPALFPALLAGLDRLQATGRVEITCARTGSAFVVEKEEAL